MSRCRSGPSDATARFIAASASCCGSYFVHMRPTLTGRYGQVRGNFVRMIAVDEGRNVVRVSARCYRDEFDARPELRERVFADDVTSEARNPIARSSHFPHSAKGHPNGPSTGSRPGPVATDFVRSATAHKPMRPLSFWRICELHHSRVPARSLDNALRAARTRHRKDGRFRRGTKGRSRSTGWRIIPQDRPVRSLPSRRHRPGDDSLDRRPGLGRDGVPDLARLLSALRQRKVETVVCVVAATLSDLVPTHAQTQMRRAPDPPHSCWIAL